MHTNLTNQQINEMSIRQINTLFRAQDNSHLWLACPKFNVTERAIRRLRRLRREGLEVNSGLEYWVALEGIISDIVCRNL